MSEVPAGADLSAMSEDELVQYRMSLIREVNTLQKARNPYRDLKRQGPWREKRVKTLLGYQSLLAETKVELRKRGKASSSNGFERELAVVSRLFSAIRGNGIRITLDAIEWIAAIKFKGSISRAFSWIKEAVQGQGFEKAMLEAGWKDVRRDEESIESFDGLPLE